MIRAALIAVCLAPLAACGFTPVYGGQGAAFQNAGPITIPEIQGRTGHYLRNELARELGQGVPGFPAGSLEIDLTQGVERLAFAPDQAASRSDYVGTAKWQMKSVSGVVLAEGNVRERASFNFADFAYADLAAQTAAQERLATLLARSIRAEVLIAAGRKKEAAAAPAAPAAKP
jgi:LPS-assembly lipoprotein